MLTVNINVRFGIGIVIFWSEFATIFIRLFLFQSKNFVEIENRIIIKLVSI